MDFIELAKARYSCRSFLDKQVEKEKIDLILEAGRLAPTARNLQPQRILVITDKEKIEELKECTPFTFNAPVILAICYDKDVSWKRKYDKKEEGIIDASIVATHMMLQIADLGLGSTLVGYFDPAKAIEILDIPNNYEIETLLPFGYPAEDAKPSPMHYERQNIEKLAFWNDFNRQYYC